MTQDQDVFRKVGRGGAGNYVSASKPAVDDRGLEAQDTVPFQPEAKPPGPARAGRGGAGNVVDAAQLPDARETGQHMSAAVEARLKQQRHGGGMGGRGGAGNWASTAEGEGAASDADGAGTKAEELERKAKEAVDKGLRMPEKVHHGRDKGGEERGLWSE